jgi:hypothetical protein
MFDRSKFVPYFEVEQHLETRLQATPDEIAQWVSLGTEQGGLDAYTINKHDTESRLFTFEPRHFINDDDYITPLLRLYFLPNEIKQFHPVKRYIARQVLIERWTGFLGDKAQAISFIEARANESRLTEFHPIVGVVESEGQLFRNGLFDLNDVGQIESEWFKVIGDSELAKERRKGTAQIKASRATKFEFSNQELLDSHLPDLIQEAGLHNANDFDYSWNLYVWKGQLANELEMINRSDYPNKKDYDDRIRALNLKIREIEQSLDDYCPPTEAATSIPTLEYGEAELSPSDAIGLYPALKILGADWTAEEFALQGIRVFEKSNVDGMLRPVLNMQDWLAQHGIAEDNSGEMYHVDSILQDFRYSKQDLLGFKPNFRYLSFKQACERVSKLTGSNESAERFLLKLLNRSEIIAYHPLHGRVSLEKSQENERWLRCFFEDWKIAELIRTELGEESNAPEIDESSTDDVGNMVEVTSDREQSNADIKKQKVLIPKCRSTTELLDLIYQFFEFINLQPGTLKKNCPSAKVAWGCIKEGRFKSDVIKEISGVRKTVMIELNGGDQVDFQTFARTYNRRFESPTD